MVKMSQQGDISPDASSSSGQVLGQQLNILDILKYLLSGWTWFLLSIAVFVAIAWYRYSITQKTYSGSTTVIFKDVKAAASEARLDRLTGSYRAGNVTNEILELKSNKLMRDAVTRLGADVSYIVMDYLREEELYMLPLISGQCHKT